MTLSVDAMTVSMPMWHRVELHGTSLPQPFDERGAKFCDFFLFVYQAVQYLRNLQLGLTAATSSLLELLKAGLALRSDIS